MLSKLFDLPISLLFVLALLIGVLPLDLGGLLLGMILLFVFFTMVADRRWHKSRKIFFVLFILIFLNLLPLYRIGGDCSGPNEPDSISVGWPMRVASYFLGESEWGGCDGYTTDGPGHPINKGDIRYSPANLVYNMILVFIVLPFAFWRIKAEEKKTPKPS